MMMGNMSGGMGDNMMNMGGGMQMGNMNMGGGAQMNMGSGGMGYQGMGQGTGLFGGGDLTSLLSGILNFAVELFVILLVIGLIVGIVAFIKRALFEGTPVLGVCAPKKACTKCGTILRADWNNCPKCGEFKNV